MLQFFYQLLSGAQAGWHFVSEKKASSAIMDSLDCHFDL
ncbi:hypothetical protein CEV33_1992 [Brucella grignonensis]|jgi:hypothetical protein|uniref:Uncharacterized protein n=2 Tax=Brucella TaxID=234 RepID=A0A256GKG4_9HYPH|nr:hypothetical protein CEV33_1992 [Brucella grignonensis]OYR27579.1 hypothetical protein CEV34_1662 [Brucella pseudogrignonensis]